MNKITKNLIFVFTLVAFFGFGSNFAFATAPTVVVTGPSAPATTVTLKGAYSGTPGVSTSTWFAISTSSSNFSASQSVCPTIQSVNAQSISCPITVGQTYGTGAGAITITSGGVYAYKVFATSGTDTASSAPSTFTMGTAGTNSGSFTVAVTGPTSPASTVTLRGAYSNTTTGGGSVSTWFAISTSSSNFSASQSVCPTIQSVNAQSISCPITVGQTYGTGAGAITITSGGVYAYEVFGTLGTTTIHSAPSTFTMGTTGTSTAPTLTSISPTSGTAGNSYPVTLTGTGFGSGSTVSYGSGITVTGVTVVSTTSITADIAIAASATGTRSVSVTSGGQISNTRTFTINAPASTTCATTVPSIDTINPTSVTAGSGSTNLTVNGSGFTNGTTVVLFNGSSRTTTVSGNVATASLNSSDISSAGSNTITATNGTNCVSNGKTFTVNAVNNGGGGGGGGGGYYYTAPTINVISSTLNGITTATLYGSVNPNSYATTTWFKYGTSTNSMTSETEHTIIGNQNYLVNFNATTGTLSPNTTYYFQAMASNASRTVSSDAILSFTTTAQNNNSSVTTVIATSKTSTSARLNGVAVLQDGVTNNGYFEYGTSSSFGHTTTAQNLGSTNSTVNFSDTITGLTPGTIYYFRAVESNTGTPATGNTFVFQTLGSDAGDVAPTPTSSVTTTKSEILNITTKTDKVSVGDSVEYLITYKNISAKNFENTKITIQLPKEITFNESNFGKVDSSNAVTFNPDILIASQVGSITIKGQVNGKALTSSVLLTTATMTYNPEGSSIEKDEIDYVSNHVVDGNNLAAASIFGAGFFPSTLIGWMILILIIMALIIVSRKLYLDYGFKKRVTIDSANME
ncbi:MAG: hypothetical protein NT068_00780 [Candidatus Nomurabacteria bacterium]|nr:hypothetical protein [Candidatus Nomurabacteria bacterium]